MLQLFVQILDIAKPHEEGEQPKDTYHRQCRSIFTLERNLDKLSQLDAKERANCNSTDSRRSSIRQPTPILVEFISGFVYFAKRINPPGTLAQGRNSAWICTLMKHSGRLLQENMITESWLSSPESLWLLKRATISHAIAISAPEISHSLGIRKKTASVPNISKPNCTGRTTLEPICYKILGF